MPQARTVPKRVTLIASEAVGDSTQGLRSGCLPASVFVRHSMLEALGPMATAYPVLESLSEEKPKARGKPAWVEL